MKGITLTALHAEERSLSSLTSQPIVHWITLRDRYHFSVTHTQFATLWLGTDQLWHCAAVPPSITSHSFVVCFLSFIFTAAKWEYSDVISLILNVKHKKKKACFLFFANMTLCLSLWTTSVYFLYHETRTMLKPDKVWSPPPASGEVSRQNKLLPPKKYKSA